MLDKFIDIGKSTNYISHFKKLIHKSKDTNGISNLLSFPSRIFVLLFSLGNSL